MKVVTPEISWHGREPILSIDLQPCTGNLQRIASAGGENVVRVWRVRVNGDKVDIDYLSSLKRHTATVNVCRFSPDGNYLATAGDDTVILLWKLNEAPPPSNNIFNDDDDDDNKETWVVHKTLRGHLGDVYDLCWSPDSRFIVSGSVDNSAIAWDTHKDQKLALFSEHKNYVLGVAWDPLKEYIATLSSDRSCRIFNLNNKHCMHNISKMVFPHTAANTPAGQKPKASRLYHDDTLQTFFRRLAFSPDGQLLITPSGLMDRGDKQVSATFIFTRGSFKEPAVCLPSPNKASVAVRVCPVLFELRKVPREGAPEAAGDNAKEWEKYQTVFCLPYRVVFAVATEDSVLLYDSQQTKPFAYLSNIHYHTLSDLSWSKDGRILMVSSTDGYITVVTFDQGELGIPTTNPTPIPTQQAGAGDKPSKKKAPTTPTPAAKPKADPPTVEKMEVEKSEKPDPQVKKGSPKTSTAKAKSPSAPASDSAHKKEATEDALATGVDQVTISSKTPASTGSDADVKAADSEKKTADTKSPKREGEKADAKSPKAEGEKADAKSPKAEGEKADAKSPKGEEKKADASSPPAVSKQPKRIQFTTLSLNKK